MTKDNIKSLVRQVISDMVKDYGVTSEDAAVANVTANIAGYDAPFGSMVRRKPKVPKKKKRS